MPDSQFEELKRLIELNRLESQEAITRLDVKIDGMIKSLESCHSHCWVQNSQESQQT
jgi:hypothetical protein